MPVQSKMTAKARAVMPVLQSTKTEAKLWCSRCIRRLRKDLTHKCYRSCEANKRVVCEYCLSNNAECVTVGSSSSCCRRR